MAQMILHIAGSASAVPVLAGLRQESMAPGLRRATGLGKMPQCQFAFPRHISAAGNSSALP